MGSVMGHAEALEKKPSAAAVNPAKYGGYDLRHLPILVLRSR
jgi:hypothetical protein